MSTEGSDRSANLERHLRTTEFLLIGMCAFVLMVLASHLQFMNSIKTESGRLLVRMSRVAANPELVDRNAVGGLSSLLGVKHPRLVPFGIADRSLAKRGDPLQLARARYENPGKRPLLPAEYWEKYPLRAFRGTTIKDLGRWLETDVSDFAFVPVVTLPANVVRDAQYFHLPRWYGMRPGWSWELFGNDHGMGDFKGDSTSIVEFRPQHVLLISFANRLRSRSTFEIDWLERSDGLTKLQWAYPRIATELETHWLRTPEDLLAEVFESGNAAGPTLEPVAGFLVPSSLALPSGLAAIVGIQLYLAAFYREWLQRVELAHCGSSIAWWGTMGGFAFWLRCSALLVPAVTCIYATYAQDAAIETGLSWHAGAALASSSLSIWGVRMSCQAAAVLSARTAPGSSDERAAPACD